MQDKPIDSLFEPFKSPRELNRAINLLPDAILILDNKGRVFAWNKAMEKLTGVKATKIIGKKNMANQEQLLADLTNVRQEDSKNGNLGEFKDNFYQQRRDINEMYGRFQKKFPFKLTLAEFKFCLWKKMVEMKFDSNHKAKENQEEDRETEQKMAA